MAMTEQERLLRVFEDLEVPHTFKQYTVGAVILMDCRSEQIKTQVDCWVEFKFGEAGEFEHMGVYTRDGHGPFELNKREGKPEKPDTSFPPEEPRRKLKAFAPPPVSSPDEEKTIEERVEEMELENDAKQKNDLNEMYANFKKGKK